MDTDTVSDLVDPVDLGLDVQNRRVYLYGGLGFKAAKRLDMALAILRGCVPTEASAVEVCINSEGGKESAGFAIYDSLRACPYRVVTIGTGAAMSMAALVLQAGDVRLLTPSTRFMFHSGTSAGRDEMSQVDFIAAAKEMEAVTRMYVKLLSARSKFSEDEVWDMCQRDTYMSAYEAGAAGFADRVVEPRSWYETAPQAACGDIASGERR